MSETQIFTQSAHYTALRSLFMVAMHRGVQLQPESFAEVDEADTTGSILRVMEKVKLRGKILRGSKWRHITDQINAFPIMAMNKDGFWFIIVNTVKDAGGQSAAIINPLSEQDGIKLIPRDQFVEAWSGTLILCKQAPTQKEEVQPFGLRWFMPEIMRQKRYFKDVAIAAMMNSLIAFATPMLFQLLIDRVITHRSYTTLTSVVILFFVLTLFDGMFNYIRQRLMIFITSKIDARLASRTFHHLLSLPLAFFEGTTAGVIIRHMQQTETIRHFLTGRLFATLLDAMAFPLMVVMLFMYSVQLSCVVLAFSAVIAIIIGVMVPTFRRQLEGLYAVEGARQGHLVETIHGMRTVKSMALEPVRLATWDDRVAAGVRRRASVGRFSAGASVLTDCLTRLMTVSILGLGAIDVFNGELTVGALVAFNMVSSRVTGPLVQMVGLINEYQEAALSVRMLGIVMQHPPERDPNQVGMTPVITGKMEFDNVTFRYPNTNTPVLDRVSFSIEPGQVIGIVGRSGSGKTTVTRLIQSIHTAQEGVVRLDGVDIRHIDLGHLRRSIGVVLQDNFLFRGTIHENLAAARPDASLAEVIEAARKAGAEEFIDRLPMSYSTMVEENGANFSGGQRQRLAIARALLVRPRLLIFDEATSALDPESEAIVQSHLHEIASGRTLLIVSHRLPSLLRADAILVLEHGKVVDFAPHHVLLQRCESYQRSWHQQTQYMQ